MLVNRYYMRKFMKLMLTALLILFIHTSVFGAVILQYHHVSNNTPKNTSITPEQFELHLKYLTDNGFNVVSLAHIIEKIKHQQPIKDKTVAITFDDAYIDILNHATPILKRYKYPYTIFVNPGIINQNLPANLSWQQLKSLADDGVIVANHGFEHNSIIRVENNLTQAQWLAKETNLILKAESIIQEKIGQSWRYYAYPYGEYSPRIQNWVKANKFTGFSQQSGAVGLYSDLTSVPRFPASMPYDELDSLRDKLNALPFHLQLKGKNADTVFKHKKTTSITFNIETNDFYKSNLSCYISGLGKQEIQWQSDSEFSIDFSGDLPVGRVRCNCTAPSINKPGRYYWYSKPWFILNETGDWYPL